MFAEICEEDICFLICNFHAYVIFLFGCPGIFHTIIMEYFLQHLKGFGIKISPQLLNFRGDLWTVEGLFEKI